MSYNENLRYTTEHEWLAVDGTTVTVGITDFAADQLGEVVYVDLPDTGSSLSAGDMAAEVESTKSVGEVLAPLSGTVSEVNAALADKPETVNDDPFGEGWLFRVTIDGTLPEGLLDAAAYEKLVAEEGK